MRGDLQLDPDALRRAARAAGRIAEALDGVGPGPSAAGADVERRQERLYESVRRARDELRALAADAASVAARVEEVERGVAAALRSVDDPGRARR